LPEYALQLSPTTLCLGLAFSLSCSKEEQALTPIPLLVVSDADTAETPGSGIDDDSDDSDDSDNSDDPDNETLSIQEDEVVTEAGVATVTIEVEDGVTAFMLTAESEQRVALERIINPEGNVIFDWEDWYSENQSLTSAIWPSSSEMVLNWPVRAEEGSLYEGSWQVVLSAVGSIGRYQPNSTIQVITHTKRDDDFDSGVVRVRLVYAEGVDEIEGVAEAMNAGIERWKQIWAMQGLEPLVTTESSDFDPDLPYPGDGAEEIYDLALDSAENEITMIVGETIKGGTDYLGVAGSIPGTLTAKTRSAVVISWLASAGFDGRFDDTEIGILGETMAHEMGHYMGLFHPVEQNGWSRWDACDDTPNCNSESRCRDQLGENVMFPTPICTYSGCIEQGQISPIQAEILHRYSGTL